MGTTHHTIYSLLQKLERYKKAYESGQELQLALLLEIKELHEKIQQLGDEIAELDAAACPHSNLSITHTSGEITQYKCNTCKDMWLAVKGKMWAS